MKRIAALILMLVCVALVNGVGPRIGLKLSHKPAAGTISRETRSGPQAHTPEAPYRKPLSRAH